MDYEKKYKEALEVAQRFYNNSAAITKKGLEDIFPELAENEDERIRKGLIEYFLHYPDHEITYYGLKADFVIAWLEKQGENNIGISETTKKKLEDNLNKALEKETPESLNKFLDEQKPTDNVEPKFHEGEWIIHHGTENIYQVVARIDNQYQLKYGDNYTIQKCADVDRCARLWDIAKDAKDGDVLAVEPIEGYSSSFVAIYKKQNEEDFDSYCFVGFDSKFYNGEDGHSVVNIHPATKEQRDTLFAKMKEAGYEWDADKKELKKIEQKPIQWDLVDVRAASLIRDAINGMKLTNEARCIVLNWLKSLKDRVQPQPKQEWSEKDRRMLIGLIDELDAIMNKATPNEISVYSKYTNWLKALRPQNTWKPSDEQMDMLAKMCSTLHLTSGENEIMESIYDALKKLKA